MQYEMSVNSDARH